MEEQSTVWDLLWRLPKDEVPFVIVSYDEVGAFVSSEVLIATRPK